MVSTSEIERSLERIAVSARGVGGEPMVAAVRAVQVQVALWAEAHATEVLLLQKRVEAAEARARDAGEAVHRGGAGECGRW